MFSFTTVDFGSHFKFHSRLKKETRLLRKEKKQIKNKGKKTQILFTAD